VLSSRCRDVLDGWTAPDAAQSELRVLFLDHLATRPDGWSRSCTGAHLTASSLICSAADGKVLLTLHAKLGRWLQTGGHIEAADPDLPAAALREAAEESGLPELQLELDPEPLLLSRHEVPCGVVRPTFHLDVQFLVRAVAAVPPVVGAESLDVRWFDHDRLPGTDDSVRELVVAAGRRLGW
jgi:8-oxo-dGTP pyrophosphatase MutT (NUDIX family)